VVAVLADDPNYDYYLLKLTTGPETIEQRLWLHGNVMKISGFIWNIEGNILVRKYFWPVSVFEIFFILIIISIAINLSLIDFTYWWLLNNNFHL
jgi:hypothetical protein